MTTARRLALVWGVHPVTSAEVRDVGEMIDDACEIAVRDGFAQPGGDVVVVAGLPFGRSGTTNLLHVARIPGAAVGSSMRSHNPHGQTK